MAWTYGASPASSNRDAVRLTVGDTDTNDQQLQDSEVDYFLGLFGVSGDGRVVPAAIRCCETLAAKYARQTDTTNQELQVAASKRMGQYQDLAQTLRRQESTVAEVFAGGVYLSENDKLNDNTDLVKPAFRVGQNDFVRRDADGDWCV